MSLGILLAGQWLVETTGTQIARTVQVGRWMLERPLGRGGMAELWLARAEGTAGPRVVVKRMLPELVQHAQARTMFHAEARLGALMRHPRIVQLIDSGEDDHGDPYLVLEHVEGTDLRVALAALEVAGRRMPAVLAVHIAREVLLALAHAHTLRDEHGRTISVVHRDVSPGNILLSSTGEVKICDFGVAKVAAQRTSGRFLKGKVRYMSPEQATGAAVDPRTDQFAVGAVLWEMLTGGPRFTGESLRDILTSVIAGGLPRDHALDVPGGDLLLAILDRALRPAPADRFASALELAGALGLWLTQIDRTDPVPLLRRIVMQAQCAAADLEALRRDDDTAVDGSPAFRAA